MDRKTGRQNENLNKQKIKNLKIIQDRLLFTSSCYRDPFQFFIGYNLLIQIAGSEASSFAVSSEDIDKERFTLSVYGTVTHHTRLASGFHGFESSMSCSQMVSSFNFPVGVRGPIIFLWIPDFHFTLL